MTSPFRDPARAALAAAYVVAGGLAFAWFASLGLFARGGRGERIGERLGRWPRPPRRDRPWLWIHAASLGEVRVATALAAELAPALAADVVVTTQTATGRAQALQWAHRLTAARSPWRASAAALPLDFGPAITRALRGRGSPLVFIAVETEIWPRLLAVLRSRQVPTAVANARLAPDAVARYGPLRRLIGPAVAGIDAVLARSPEDAERWLALGARPQAVRILGDIKFDLAAGSQVPATQDEAAPRKPQVVAASTHEGEEETVLAAFAELRKTQDVRLVLVPRHPERALEVAGKAKAAGFRVSGEGGAGGDADVIVVGRVGALAEIYAESRACFVGGSLVRGPGGHNLLEPLVAGCPLATGPHLANVSAQADLARESGALGVVADARSLAEHWKRVLAVPASCDEAIERARAEIRARRGALGRARDAIVDLAGGGSGA